MTTSLLEPDTRPFGLTRAVPFVPQDDNVIPPLTLCPERQVSITAIGTPFIHEPSMTTQTTSQTTYTTTTDHQSWNDSDTAPSID
jgi:putative ATP-grasp target RiPP